MAVVISLDTALDYEEIVGGMLFDIANKIAEIEANDDLPVEWTFAERKQQLEYLTRLTVALNLQLAMYPLSLAAVITLDEPICPP